jgi:hypothetical protein
MFCKHYRCWDRAIASTFVAIVTMIGLALGLPAVAGAAFTRPFLRQITRTEVNSGLSCSSGGSASVSCFAPLGGVAVDSSNDVWVGDGDEALSEFGSSGNFVGTVALKFPDLETQVSSISPEHLAIDSSNGEIYDIASRARKSAEFAPHLEVFTPTGEFVERWTNEFRGLSALAIDNSTDPFDPSAGSVYVAHNETNAPAPVGNGRPPGIERFTASGEFKGAFGGQTSSIAISPEGDVYGLNNHGTEAQINEYSPNGTFIRSFSGEETPGLGEDRQDDHGFGGEPVALAIDPVSSHVLVSVRNFFGNEAAVDEFDASGHFLNQITKTEVESPLGEHSVSHLDSAFDMTVDAQGDLYVVDHSSNETSENAIDVYGPGKFFPNLKLAEATNLESTGVVLNGSVDPEGETLSGCSFEYVTEAAFQHNEEVNKGEGFADLSAGGTSECDPPANGIPANSVDDPVKTTLTGLTSGTTYRYRLIAASSGPLGGSSASAAHAFTALDAPRIDSTLVTNLSSKFADLRAEIDPLGSDTKYLFEYVSAENYDSKAADPYAAGSMAPANQVDIGSGGPTGSGDASVVQEIGGLSPGTTYHFRVVASNKIGTTQGAGGGRTDNTFTTLPRIIAGLPDDRSYEMVTPSNKGGASDMFGTSKTFFNSDVGYPSDSGNEFLLTNTLANFGAFGGSEKNAYVFRRDPDSNEWKYESLVSPALGVQSVENIVSDPEDFSREIALSEFVGSTASPEGASVTAFIGHPGGPYAVLQKDLPVHEEPEDLEHTSLVGGSQDLSHVVLETENHALAPGDTGQDPGSNTLYERIRVGSSGCKASSATFSTSAGGCVALVNGNGEGELASQCGAVLGQSHSPGTRHNAVSPDGSKVFFTAPDPYRRFNPESSKTAQETNECWNGATKDAPQVYMHSRGGIVKLSAPEEGWTPSGGTSPAIYVGASEDGSRVYFASETELTKDDAGLHDLELYECHIVEEAEGAKCKLDRISAGTSGTAAAEVWTVPAVAANGSAVYFTALGQLTPGLQPLASGEVYLYRYDTSTRETAYVATVGVPDYETGLTSNSKWYPREIALSADANWYATPDGRYLLFATARELTGYDTTEATANDCQTNDSGGGSGLTGHCAEIYRYHYEPEPQLGGSIICVSCNPSGARPVSNAQFAARSAAFEPSGGSVRAMSDDGSYAFFDTADGLVPQDSNHTLDVYEWHEGGISLISSGQDLGPSFLLGSSSDGSNVFFGTHAKLVPQDGDSAGDMYDARICEPEAGNPCLKSVSGGTGQCEGDACHNPPPTPIDATPVSLTFAGPGNSGGEAAKKAPVTLTNAQKLSRALKVCRKEHNKSRRKKCEAQARQRYGKKASKSTRHRRVGAAGRRRG